MEANAIIDVLLSLSGGFISFFISGFSFTFLMFSYIEMTSFGSIPTHFVYALKKPFTKTSEGRFLKSSFSNAWMNRLLIRVILAIPSIVTPLSSLSFFKYSPRDFIIIKGFKWSRIQGLSIFY